MNAHSLSGRVTLLVGMAAALILGTAALLMDHLVDDEMGQRFDNGVLNEARALAALTETRPDGLSVGEFSKPSSRLLAGASSAAYAIRCDDGGALDSDPAPEAYPPGWTQTPGTEPTFADIEVNDRDLRAVWLRFSTAAVGTRSVSGISTENSGMQATRCRLLLVQSRAELDHILGAIDAILLLTPALALLAVLLLSPALVRHGLRPLVALGDKMRDIGPNASSHRLATAGTRELEPLVARFNEVLARMDEGMTRERQFAGAVAHETRTRLAELRALVEVEQRYPTGRSTLVLLSEIGSIGAELENTVSGLLLLTRLDGGIQGIDLHQVDLDVLVNRQLAHIATTLQRHGLRTEVERPTHPGLLIADRSLLDIIIGNLLSNACMYAPAGTSIGVRHRVDSLTISNHATDLTSEEVARFGHRFWSKHHGADGHVGLGLALAGSAATAMGFRLEFNLDAAQRLHASLHWRDDRGDSEAMQVADTETTG